MNGFECLPHQGWMRVLDTAIGFGAGHLSCYELTVHDGTAFGRLHRRGELRLLGQDQRADSFRATVGRLADAGYEQYEVSNFAVCRGSRSPHNQKYWQSVPYLGVGPGAHSFALDRRWSNRRSLRDWSEALRPERVNGAQIADVETLNEEQRKLEWVLLRSRTSDGLDLADYRRRFGMCLLESHTPYVRSLVSRGLAILDSDILRLTTDGLLVADSVALDLS